MISPHCFSFKWIDEKRRELGCDPAILEKSVHALDLLALLAENGPYFVFKGGTSLLLRLPTIRRLSIDIDMVCQDFDAIKSTLDKFCKPEARFFRWEHDLRRDRENPPLRHIKVYYKPVAGAGKFDEYVLLDILTSPPSYPKIELLPISIPSLDIGADHQVNVAMPSVEGLLADKLAAFAPTTIGILYSKGEVLQIAKQLFDVGELFEMEHELKNIRTAYKAIFAEENRYRGGRHTFESCLKDTIEAGMKLSRMELKGAPPEDEEAKALRKGINNLSGNLVQCRFRVSLEARVAASKAACLASLLMDEDASHKVDKLRYLKGIHEQRLNNLNLPAPFEALNRLKTINQEAFYYWCLALKQLSWRNLD